MAKRLAEFMAKKQGIDLGDLSEEALKNFMNFINDGLKALDDGAKGIGEFLGNAGKEMDKLFETKKTVTTSRDRNAGEVKGEVKVTEMQPQIKDISERHVRHGEEVVTELLHYGVPGMKWGRRKARGAALSGRSPSADHKDARELQRKKVYELSNEELQRLTKRLDLEQKWKKANPSKIERGQKIVKQILGVGETVNSVVKFANSDVGKKVIARGALAVAQAKANAK
jgi:hypothetical protein